MKTDNPWQQVCSKQWLENLRDNPATITNEEVVHMCNALLAVLRFATDAKEALRRFLP